MQEKPLKQDLTRQALESLFPGWGKRTRAYFKKDTGLCAWCAKPPAQHDQTPHGVYFCQRKNDGQ